MAILLDEIVIPRAGRNRRRALASEEVIHDPAEERLANQAVSSFVAHRGDVDAGRGLEGEDTHMVADDRQDRGPLASAADSVFEEPKHEEPTIDFDPPVDAVAGRTERPHWSQERREPELLDPWESGEPPPDGPSQKPAGAVTPPVQALDSVHIVEPAQSPAEQPTGTQVSRAADQAVSTDAQSPASPANDSRNADWRARRSANEATDREEFDRARRRQRIGAGVQGGLKGLQAILSIIGHATGNPAAAALSGLSGVGAGLVDPDRAMQDVMATRDFREHAEDRMMAGDQQVADLERQAEASRRAQRHEDLWEQGLRETAQTHREQAQHRAEDSRRKGEEFAAHFSPTHANAALARQEFANALERYAAATGGTADDFAETAAGLENAGYDAIRSVIEDVQHYTDARQRKTTTRGSGGGGSPATSADRDRLLAAWSQRTGRSREDAAAIFPNTREGNARLRADEVASTHGHGGRGGAASASAAGTSMVPGWEIENAGVASSLTQNQLDKARETVATFETLASFTVQMERLADQASLVSRGGARAGAKSAVLARAAQLQEQISNSLRTIGGYGVPNGTELERMQALAPTLDSLDGIVNAKNVYRALRSAMRESTSRTMRSRYGYRRPQAAAAAPTGGAQ